MSDKYVVTSDRCVLGNVGDTVEVPDGVNGKALVKAGHLKVKPKPPKKRTLPVKKAAK